ncbi:MAG: cell division protein FtsA [Halocynthiibacter sp.]
MTDLYSAQRAMRHMRKAAIQRGVVSILDVGSSKVACLVLRFDSARALDPNLDDKTMLGQTGFRVIGAATTKSRGVRFGEISTMNETELAIRTVVQAAQKMANQRVDHVIACFGGADPRSYGLSGEVALQDGACTDDDVSSVLAACDMPDLGAGRDVLHAQPINFALDHRSGLGDPRGQIGHHLATDMHLVSVNADAIQNLLYCIKRCDLEVAGLASSSYMAGLSSLVEDEQELGSCVIDLGGGTTGMSIFLKKHMIFNDVVRMGGEHISRDISMGLQVPLQVAERIKTRHGGIYATSMDDRDEIEISGETGDWEHDRRKVTRTELIGIIRPRVEEIFEEVRARLDAAGFDHLSGQKIVLTGGGSQIPGLDGLASKILDKPVRLGRPMRIQGLPQATTGPAFSAAVGLCLAAVTPQDEWWDFDQPSNAYPAKSLKRALRWFKDNW